MAEKINESHQRFLQVLMSHGIMEGSSARALHRHCCEIRKGMSEDDGQTHYALVNLAETEITKMASDYAENELELFRKTMELIILSDNGFASSTHILNLSDQLQSKKMKKKEVEQVLQSFVQKKWLTERDGEYTLHTRCIMEMEHYIRNTYQDLVKICNICHNIVIQSQMCETCGIQMHLPCIGKYFRGKTEPRCPHCNEYWPHDIPIINQTNSEVPPTQKEAPRTREKSVAGPSMVSRRSR